MPCRKRKSKVSIPINEVHLEIAIHDDLYQHWALTESFYRSVMERSLPVKVVVLSIRRIAPMTSIVITAEKAP
jgi:hypothetical protein